MPDLPAWAAAVVEEIDVDQDAHTATAQCSRAIFDNASRAIRYASSSDADTVTVYDRDGMIIYPEEARV